METKSINRQTVCKQANRERKVKNGNRQTERGKLLKKKPFWPEETDGEHVDKAKSVVKELCACMADAENIVAANRVHVGPAKSRGVNSKGAPSWRMIRVRMTSWSSVACRRILRARFALKSLSPPRKRTFITEYLTHSERMRKNDLVPVYKDMKAGSFCTWTVNR